MTGQGTITDPCYDNMEVSLPRPAIHAVLRDERNYCLSMPFDT